MTTHGQLRRLALALSSAAMLTLTACGGGSSDSGTPPPAPPPATPMSSVPVTVIDDAIRNAKVCLDVNRNGVCDAGEPSGVTDASGNASISVATADVGKYPVLAEVTTASVDAKYGPVAFPFTLQAPADKSGVVSPLTTLVQTVIANSGVSSADAEATLRTQTGVNVSFFDDFTKSSSADSANAGTVARLVVVVTQQQSTALSGSVGSAAVDGTTITQANINLAIQKKLLEILPSLVAAVADTSVTSAGSDTAKSDALLALANAIVADPATNLTPTSIATVVAINNQTAAPNTAAPDAVTAGASLARLSFTSATKWSSRVHTSSLAQNTPDAAGMTRSVAHRLSKSGSSTASWTSGSGPNRQADLHFNGTSWGVCPLNYESKGSVRDSKGNSSYDECDQLEVGTSQRAVFDIAGKSMADVYSQIINAGYVNLFIDAASTKLGATAFPANAKIFYQTNTGLTTAVSYSPGTDSNIVLPSLAISAGGVASQQPGATGCNSDDAETKIATLERMIAGGSGTPCFNQPHPSFTYKNATYTSAETTNEMWGSTSFGLGTTGTAPLNSGTAPGYFTTNRKLRVAFRGDGANAVTYYSCLERFTDGSSRNCVPISTGTYAIATVGDARVLSFNNLPPAANALGYQRVFVERQGQVYVGFKNIPATGGTARFNLAATNALFSQLGLSQVDPAAPLALTTGSYQGTWDLIDSVPENGVLTVAVYADGSVACTNADGILPCTFAITNPATGAYNLTITGPDGGVSTGSFNFMTGAVTGTYTDAGQQVPSGSFTGARR